MTDAYHGLREDYDTPGLEPGELTADPLVQIAAWLDEAIASGVIQANAASLATAGADGRPSVRTVLLKDIDDGLVVYSNYRSRKGHQLAENPWAALSLTWVSLHRSVRAEGLVERTAPHQSDAYFARRPRGAQLAAVASQQSSEIASRTSLEETYDATAARYPDVVPRPAHWGGLRLLPVRVEFWQGRANRLHDRIEYLREDDGWVQRRLAP